MAVRHADVHARSLRDPEGFWAEAAEAVHWDRRFERVLDDSRAPFTRWFVGGETNTCYNALDRHVEAGRADQPALIYDSPVTGTIRTYRYRELREEVARLAGALARLGVGSGDRVLIYMPMVPETVMAMLASARLGAIHSVVFGGFASRELAVRIEHARPKLILAASCGIEGDRIVPYKPLLDGALEAAKHRPEHCLVLQRSQQYAELRAPRDLDWNEACAGAAPADCVPVAATDPLYILYTSGTTGSPKGVVRDTGGHLVALHWSLRNVYGMQPGEVFWAASDVGWVVGHSYIVYAPLFLGCTTILYEGKPVGTPDAGAFWRVISQHGAAALFTAPTALRAIKREDPEGRHVGAWERSQFRKLFLAGERADPDTVAWAQKILGVPVVDHWWQTETGWPVAANCMGLETLPIKPGSASVPVPGYDVGVLGDTGDELPPGETGNLVLRLPLPPGCLPTLWNDDEGFRKSYLARFPGFYETGDGGTLDEDGYVWVMGRTDDVINVAGHRLSTGAMEEVLAAHPDVAECAVIGVADPLKGQLPLGLVVLKAGVTRDADEIVTELVQQVRAQIGAVAAFRKACVVARLPKTRSGKILRATMRRLADGDPIQVPATIDDPAILDEIRIALERLGGAAGHEEPHPRRVTRGARRVFDLMNPNVVCARPGMSVREVSRLLAERGVTGAPVVDDEGHVVGVVSQSDLARHLAQRVALEESGRFFTELDEYRELSRIPTDRSRTPVEEVMQRRVYTVARDAGLAVAANIMRERGVHRLLVTDRGVLVGVITTMDLLRVVEELMT